MRGGRGLFIRNINQSGTSRVAARVSLRMAPDACAATPRAPHGWLHVSVSCRMTPRPLPVSCASLATYHARQLPPRPDLIDRATSSFSVHSSNFGLSKERRSPVSLSPGSEDEAVAATRKRRRSSKGALPCPSLHRFVPEGDGSLFVARAKVAVASSKVIKAFNEYVVVMEDHVVASRNDKEIESIDRDIRRASRVAHRDIVTRYREILESLKDKWTSKKKGVFAEIQLHEVIANIDLLNELKDGDLTVYAELARLKEMEGDCEDLVASAAVSDWSISELDLPQVSDDSVDQVEGSSVPDDSASS
ncbi:hypothetical protein F2Q69_00023559 [Brassica cretica]|uniref:Uncharacterized protein n=1 Tax=Brassica cretica TaxID=69181 RepID=A0A8S9QC49_BRACR|nr:hypothetical protein F2Q69_00023559 [Brassica cretica]